MDGGDVKRGRERDTSAVMEMAGRRGYYEMKAINECERTEERKDGEMENGEPLCVSVLYVYVSVDEERLSLTCRAFNKVSMLGVSFAPRWHRIALHEPSRTSQTAIMCLENSCAPRVCGPAFKRCSVCASVSVPCYVHMYDTTRVQHREGSSKYHSQIRGCSQHHRLIRSC